MKTSLTIMELKNLSNDQLIATYKFAKEKYKDGDVDYELQNIQGEMQNRFLIEELGEIKC